MSIVFLLLLIRFACFKFQFSSISSLSAPYTRSLPRLFFWILELGLTSLPNSPQIQPSSLQHFPPWNYIELYLAKNVPFIGIFLNTGYFYLLALKYEISYGFL